MKKISVSVVYAEPEQQWVRELSVVRGSSVEDVLLASGVMAEVPALKGRAIAELSLGVFAEKVEPDELVGDGDRIEIYRPLTADPKEVRRQLALLGKTMGNKEPKL